MATEFGYGGTNGIYFNVKNIETFAIVEGQGVKITPSVVAEYSQTGDPIFPVEVNDIADGTSGEGGVVLGVARRNIGPGKVGSIVVFGLARILSDGVLITGDVIAPKGDIFLGFFTKALGASHESPCGYMIEPVSASEVTSAIPKLAFVDFIASATHVTPSSGDKFHGIAF